MNQDYDLLQGAEHLKAVPTSGIRTIMNKAAALRAEGHSVIPFSAGEPSFNTPEPMAAETIKALNAHMTHYPANWGQLSLRKAIAEKVLKDTGVAYDPATEILVTCGGAEGLNDCICSVVDPGDEVIIFKPAFINYEALVKECGGKVVDVNLRPENGFAISIADVEAAVTERTKLIVINSPNNPTGVVYSRDELAELCRLAVKYNFLILSDEMYSGLTYDGAEFCSIASFPGMKERSLIVNGFSKTYAMTGWRLGYVTGPAKLMPVLVKHHQYVTTSITTFIQEGAANAMNLPETMAEVATMHDAFARRRKLMMDGLDRIEKLSYIKPSGAFYIMVDVSRTGMTGEEFAEKLLYEKYVATVPAVCLGSHCGDFVRFSFAADEDSIREGLKRIEEFLGTLGASAGE